MCIFSACIWVDFVFVFTIAVLMSTVFIARDICVPTLICVTHSLHNSYKISTWVLKAAVQFKSYST
jgi:hypothetical protein